VSEREVVIVCRECGGRSSECPICGGDGTQTIIARDLRPDDQIHAFGAEIIPIKNERGPE